MVKTSTHSGLGRGELKMENPVIESNAETLLKFITQILISERRRRTGLTVKERTGGEFDQQRNRK